MLTFMRHLGPFITNSEEDGRINVPVMRTLTTPRIRMPCSHFHLPNHRCMRCGIRARGVGKWKEAEQTQRGARQSAEEAIKAEFSSGFSNIYYVFPFRCSTTERLSHLPASSFLPSSFLLLLLTPAAASWQKCESFSRIRSRARVILFILPAPSSTTFSPRDMSGHNGCPMCCQRINS